ncbi:MAG: PKD domain-containing protein, partial [Candidatus Marinimicrobia bacterium]|nr:PKD domain-containing protein [Candidatus Neomarinimicrobiota bacterium]
GTFTATFKVWYKEIGFGQPNNYTVKIMVLPAPIVEIKVTPELLYVGGARDVAYFEAQTQPYDRMLMYQWDFGDGITASGKAAKHTYMTAGGYTVKLTVYDAARADARKFEFKKRIEIQKR